MKQQILYHKEDEPTPQKKREKHFSDYVVFVSLTAVVLYTITAFVLQFLRNVEVSPTLTTCFYSFFGVELISLATIKHAKVKNSNTESEVNNRGI